MSATALALVIASGVQGGHVPASGHETLLIGIGIVAMLAACVPIFLYLRRASRRSKPVANQWQALDVMGRLCPDGWQAQITLYGWGAPVPDDAPPSRAPLVELEWRQFDEYSSQVAVARRVWAPTIEVALEAMVEDRQTDATLEEIEQAAEDASWED